MGCVSHARQLQTTSVIMAEAGRVPPCSTRLSSDASFGSEYILAGLDRQGDNSLDCARYRYCTLWDCLSTHLDGPIELSCRHIRDLLSQCNGSCIMLAKLARGRSALCYAADV